jgi:hypothetical protein
MIISVLYLAYNALLSCQLVCMEWSNYAEERKTLRVSHPKGIQRSTYFISLPLRYGILLLAANATLHWLTSESIFVVNTTTYFPNLIEDTSESFTTTGYSTSATLAAICSGLFMLLGFVLNAFRTIPGNMPLASTCSAAISAACHRPEEDREAHLLPVQWGVIPDDTEGDTNENSRQRKRCAFTTHRDVRPPNEHDWLWGLSATKQDQPGSEVKAASRLINHMRRILPICKSRG